MALTKEEAIRTGAERMRIIGDLDGLTPGQILDRYLEAAQWVEMQPHSNRIDYLIGAAAGMAHVIAEIGERRAEYTTLLAITEDAVRTVMNAAGE